VGGKLPGKKRPKLVIKLALCRTPKPTPLKNTCSPTVNELRGLSAT
jgi:hypothetical protein